jgi:5-(carboxyamino)imidazole ribonucleotide synthase
VSEASPERFPTVAVLGGGQLARMMVPPAVALGVRLRVLAERPDDSAAQVAPATVLGAAHDAVAVLEAAAGAAVVTFEHEHVPDDVLRALREAGADVHPGAEALHHAQDKLVMRRALSGLGVPVPPWAEVADVDALRAFAAAHGGRAVLKTPRGGYDGKGVLLLGDDERAWQVAATWFDQAGGSPLLAEEVVPFSRELAVLVARSPSGQVALWPVVQTLQVDGVCREVVAPAPGLDEELAGQAATVAATIAGALDVTGVMAVEGFEVPDPAGHPRFVVNELAMRPHNSGHWTIDGSVTSQFEQHLRAVLDLPLGEVRARSTWTVMVNVMGGEHHDLYRAYLHVMARDPGVKVHLYGKAVRPGRKVGHVTVHGDDLDDLLARARHAADFITGTIDE